MEFFRAFCDEDWQSLSSLISFEDHQEFIPDFLVQHSCSLKHEELSFPPFTVGNTHQSIVGFGGVNDSWDNSLDTFKTDFYGNKPESNLCSNNDDSIVISASLHEEDYIDDSYRVSTENNMLVTPQYEMVGEGHFIPEWFEVLTGVTVCVDEDVCIERFENCDKSLTEATATPDEGLHLKRKFHGLELQERTDHTISTNLCDNLKKKTKISRDGQGNRNTVKSKKCHEHSSKEKYGEGGAISDGQSCSSNISEDEIASHENNGEPISESMASAGSGKMRASRGSATDPQSLYAKKRRERINERLKILQTLVPNGTKVDLSTMLEEAVQYVKFLQLQIKFLSSDDLWMYAPLAYNGSLIQ